MIKKSMIFTMALILIILWTVTSDAHFGMLIPSDSMVMQNNSRTVNLKLSFSHPFEAIGMDLTKPKLFSVVANTQRQDLLNALIKTSIMGHTAWEMNYPIKRPGIYMFYMEPQPYWEQAEDRFIIHYTKTVIAAFGEDENWDAEIGLKTEIIPISKPYGLYVGNVFQGIVKFNGQPVPFSVVEIEYLNSEGKITAPTDYMMTQTIKADQNGLFTYAAPGAGWWGFAALNRADFKLKHAGEDKEVELGAVIWVMFEPWR